MTVRAIAFAFCCLCAGTGLVRAHSIVVHTGTVRWEGAELAIEIESDPHSIGHEIEALGEAVDAEVVLERLARSIAVVCDDGGRLSIDHVEHLQGKGGIRCTYNVPKQVAALALFHHPGDDAAPLARQIQLRQVTGEENGGRHLRLTSRGNYAVLLREKSAIAPAGIDPFNQPIIRLVNDDDATRHVQIDYPCTLLATWPNLIEFNSDSISGEQVDRFKPQIIKWAREHLSFSSDPNGENAASDIDVKLVGPLQKRVNAGNHVRRSLLTSRIRIEISISPSRQSKAIQVKWTGFNSAVLQMPVVQVEHEHVELIAVLTQAQPAVSIAKADFVSPGFPLARE